MTWFQQKLQYYSKKRRKYGDKRDKVRTYTHGYPQSSSERNEYKRKKLQELQYVSNVPLPSNNTPYQDRTIVKSRALKAAQTPYNPFDIRRRELQKVFSRQGVKKKIIHKSMPYAKRRRRRRRNKLRRKRQRISRRRFRGVSKSIKKYVKNALNAHAPYTHIEKRSETAAHLCPYNECYYNTYTIWRRDRVNSVLDDAFKTWTGTTAALTTIDPITQYRNYKIKVTVRVKHLFVNNSNTPILFHWWVIKHMTAHSTTPKANLITAFDEAAGGDLNYENNVHYFPEKTKFFHNKHYKLLKKGRTRLDPGQHQSIVNKSGPIRTSYDETTVNSDNYRGGASVSLLYRIQGTFGHDSVNTGNELGFLAAQLDHLAVETYYCTAQNLIYKKALQTQDGLETPSTGFTTFTIFPASEEKFDV